MPSMVPAAIPPVACSSAVMTLLVAAGPSLLVATVAGRREGSSPCRAWSLQRSRLSHAGGASSAVMTLLVAGRSVTLGRYRGRKGTKEVLHAEHGPCSDPAFRMQARQLCGD